MINKDLDNYILNHIDDEDELLQELSRQTHLKILRPRMLSGHLQGKILEMLVKMIRPKTILEIGTYTGYSAICMAKGLQNSGKLITIDINDELEKFTRSFIARSEVASKIEFLIGDAKEIIQSRKEMYDLVFIDGDKREYPKYYELVIEKVNSGGFIFADNILWDGKVLEDINKTDEYTRGIISFNKNIKQDSRVEKVILPIRDGLSILRKKDLH